MLLTEWIEKVHKELADLRLRGTFSYDNYNSLYSFLCEVSKFVEYGETGQKGTVISSSNFSSTIPVNVGDTVYKLSPFKTKIVEWEVTEIVVKKSGISLTLFQKSQKLTLKCDWNSVGTIVFLTVEALKKYYNIQTVSKYLVTEEKRL